MGHFHIVIVLLNMATFAPNDDAAGRRCAALFALSLSFLWVSLFDGSGCRKERLGNASGRQQQQQEDEQGEHLGWLAGC